MQRDAYALNELQTLPLDKKIEFAKEKIEEWYDHHEGMVYVAYSGGYE